MIGDVEDRQKVTRLWTGLSSTIQAELRVKEDPIRDPTTGVVRDLPLRNRTV